MTWKKIFREEDYNENWQTNKVEENEINIEH